MEIVQIVPRLPPPDEGVGNYATALAAELAARWGLATRFVVGDPAWSGTAADARPVAARTPDALRAALGGAAAVLLHYANYGYQARGCPAWLVEGLLRWRARPGHRLVTVFHEVYATGTPWRSSFWLSPLQRRLAEALAGASQGRVTSLDLYARMLRSGATVLPIFSTVGEPVAVPAFADRPRRLAVFGGPGMRRTVWRELTAELAAACDALGIEEIVDAGPPAGPVPERVGGIAVQQLGVLSGPGVSANLAGSRAGFLAYPPAFLPKSTVFAAYCSHGLVPVCAWPERRRVSGAAPPCWRPQADPPLEAPGRLAAEAHAWYADHTLARQAEIYQRLLRG